MKYLITEARWYIGKFVKLGTGRAAIILAVTLAYSLAVTFTLSPDPAKKKAGKEKVTIAQLQAKLADYKAQEGR